VILALRISGAMAAVMVAFALALFYVTMIY
jgi:hypothetical protein